jgi:hypothetical protein
LLDTGGVHGDVPCHMNCTEHDENNAQCGEKSDDFGSRTEFL